MFTTTRLAQKATLILVFKNLKVLLKISFILLYKIIQNKVIWKKYFSYYSQKNIYLLKMKSVKLKNKNTAKIKLKWNFKI